jgi:hypothetical protein
MAKAQIDNHGPGPLRVQLDDGSWHEVPVGETFVGEILVVNNGKSRAHYTFGPYEQPQS